MSGIATALVVLAGLGVQAAGEPSDGVGPEAGLGTATTPPTAAVRVLNALAADTAIDVYVDGALVAGALERGALSDEANVDIGPTQVEVVEAGTDRDARRPALVSLGDDGLTTIAIHGQRDDIELTLIGGRAMPLADSAQIRFVHLAGSELAIDIEDRSGESVVDASTAGATSPYISVDPGPVDLVLRATGNRDVVLGLPPLEARAGHSYSVVITADPVSGSLATLAVVDAVAELAWQRLPVRECAHAVVFQPTFRQRENGWADALIPTSGSRDLALYHADPTFFPQTSGFMLAPDGWACQLYALGDFDTSEAVRVVVPRAFARDRCWGEGPGPRPMFDPWSRGEARCQPSGWIAIGEHRYCRVLARDPRCEGPETELACAHNRQYRRQNTRECRGTAARIGELVHEQRADGERTWWYGHEGRRGGLTTTAASGATCSGGECRASAFECRVDEGDKAMCTLSRDVLLDPSRVRVPTRKMTVACARTSLRTGQRGGPPVRLSEQGRRATLRRATPVVVDAVAILSAAAEYRLSCPERARDALWYRVREVDGGARGGWVAKPLLRDSTPPDP